MIGGIIYCVAAFLFFAFCISMPFIGNAMENKKLKKLIQEHGKIVKASFVLKHIDVGLTYGTCVEKRVFSGQDLKLTCENGMHTYCYVVETADDKVVLEDIEDMVIEFEDGTSKTLYSSEPKR